MTEASRAGDRPLPVEVEAGKTYFWCACGLSAKQPFCDGSHRDTAFAPVKYTAEEPGKVFFASASRRGMRRAVTAATIADRSTGTGILKATPPLKLPPRLHCVSFRHGA